MNSELIGRLLFLTSLAYASLSTVSSSPASASSVSADIKEALGSSDQYFPRSDLVLDMAQLSHSIYKLKRGLHSCNAGEDEELLKLNGTECLHYSHDFELGTQVLIVRSRTYVAVAFSGTDDWRTSISDGKILTDKFSTYNLNNGTEDTVFKHQVPEGVRVHRGFNQAVFDSDHYQSIMGCIHIARSGGYCDGRSGSQLAEPLQLLTTGHSLGAADSMLLGAALHLTYPQETIRSINFGCPKVGNMEWSLWINSLQPDKAGPNKGSLEVFRFVNKIDIVARLPELLFYHAGHTIQMSVGGPVRAYYDHIGDPDLGYAPVPMGWEEAPYVLLPIAIETHMCSKYVEWLQEFRPSSNGTSTATPMIGHYVDKFERIEDLESDQETTSLS